jgi:hypothetical protein
MRSIRIDDFLALLATWFSLTNISNSSSLLHHGHGSSGAENGLSIEAVVFRPALSSPDDGGSLLGFCPSKG